MASPFLRLCAFSNVMVSSALSIPPPPPVRRASNSISRYLVSNIGCKTAPDPLPPSIVMEVTSTKSKSCGSICTSVTPPRTTGLTRAVV